MCGVPNIQFTFEHVHHTEEGKREGGLPTACAPTDPNLRREARMLEVPGSGREPLVLAWGAGVGRYGISSWPGPLISFLLARAGPGFGLVSCSGSRRGSHRDPQASTGYRHSFAWAWLYLVCGCRGTGGADVSLCAWVGQEGMAGGMGIGRGVLPDPGIISDPTESCPMGTNRKDNKGPTQRGRR